MASKRGSKGDADRAVRAVRWANLPGHGHTIAEACSRFGVTASAYRRARKAFGASVPFTGDEIVLAGLSGGNVVTVESLIFYVDWIDHAALSRGEMIAILDRLIVTALPVSCHY